MSHHPAIIPDNSAVCPLPLLLSDVHAGPAHNDRSHGVLTSRILSLKIFNRGIHQESIHQVYLPFIQLHFLSDAACHGQSADWVPARCVSVTTEHDWTWHSLKLRSWLISWRMTTSTTWCGSGRGRIGAPCPPTRRRSSSSGRSGSEKEITILTEHLITRCVCCGGTSRWSINRW